MNSSSRQRQQRVRVLRAAEVTRHGGDVASESAPVVSKADLGTITAPIARELVVDRRLVEDAVADGFREGYEAGFSAGMEESQRTGAEQTRQAVVALHQVIGQLNEAADALRRKEATAAKEIEREVVRGAFEIARLILGTELLYAESIGQDVIARALQLAPKDGLAVARLHPAIAGTVDVEAAAPGRSLQVIADPTLEPGDCVLDVGGCHVEARLGDALDRIAAVLGLLQEVENAA